MNKQLKLKRDEAEMLVPKICCSIIFREGYDQCLRDVIEMIGEFELEKDARPVFGDGRKYQHDQIMAKLKGEESIAQGSGNKTEGEE